MTDLRTPAGSTVVRLTREECLSLLRAYTQPAGAIGRLAFVRAGMAVIRPLTIIAGTDAVFFRTSAAGSIRDCEGQPATVEFDDLEPALHAGWSVLVTGNAHQCDPECADFSDVWSLQPWADGSRPHVTAVPFTELSGLRLVPKPSHSDATT